MSTKTFNEILEKYVTPEMREEAALAYLDSDAAYIKQLEADVEKLQSYVKLLIAELEKKVKESENSGS